MSEEENTTHNITGWIYLKSGQVIELQKLKKLKWDTRDNEVYKLHWVYHQGSDANVYIGHIVLDQIAAITYRSDPI